MKFGSSLIRLIRPTGEFLEPTISPLLSVRDTNFSRAIRSTSRGSELKGKPKVIYVICVQFKEVSVAQMQLY
ncbi:hypothetical protein O6P43_020345 [Quillaja saponaria]|uniref:Uncharacterized protein n=1 Tax=Quillaja saponaria TaxID=32244 RepID=A0AAD7PL60_QUISA|nr:hypothetical protein O6P43_020345 [Quillaja saponaria]